MDEKKVMEAIRAVRERMGLTQSQFAERIGKSYPTLQRYEGVRPPKGVEMLPILQLAEAASVDEGTISTLRQAALAAIPEELAQLAKQEWGLSEETTEHAVPGFPRSAGGTSLPPTALLENSTNPVYDLFTVILKQLQSLKTEFAALESRIAGILDAGVHTNVGTGPDGAPLAPPTQIGPSTGHDSPIDEARRGVEIALRKLERSYARRAEDQDEATGTGK